MKKKTRNVILGLLRDESMTGYEIKNCIDKRMSFFWQESYGQIYPELSAMIKEGLIIENDDQSNKRGRIKYSITEEGITAFDMWMTAENEKETVRSEALLKFFLADDKNKEDLKYHLEQFYEQNKERLTVYRMFEENLLGFADMHNNHKYILRMLELGIKQQELYCNWSKEYLDDLKGNDEK
jgi:PadR family transcriptional regulator AphA